MVCPLYLPRYLDRYVSCWDAELCCVTDPSRLEQSLSPNDPRASNGPFHMHEMLGALPRSNTVDCNQAQFRPGQSQYRYPQQYLHPDHAAQATISDSHYSTFEAPPPFRAQTFPGANNANTGWPPSMGREHDGDDPTSRHSNVPAVVVEDVGLANHERDPYPSHGNAQCVSHSNDTGGWTNGHQQQVSQSSHMHPRDDYDASAYSQREQEHQEHPRLGASI